MNENSHIDLVISKTHGFITPYHSTVLYLKLGICSRIFYVGLVQLDVQPAEFSRAVQGNLRRSFKTSSDQFVLQPANLTRVTSPRGLQHSHPGACKGDHQLKGEMQPLLSSCSVAL